MIIGIIVSSVIVLLGTIIGLYLYFSHSENNILIEHLDKNIQIQEEAIFKMENAETKEEFNQSALNMIGKLFKNMPEEGSTIDKEWGDKIKRKTGKTWKEISMSAALFQTVPEKNAEKNYIYFINRFLIFLNWR